jgi:hypothetical protein
MPGRSVLIRADTLIRFVARPAGMMFDLPDASNAPTAGGGTLHVLDTGPGFREASFSLPPAGWKALGTAGTPTGYRYQGAGTTLDPCTTVVIRRNVVKATCRRTDDLSLPVAGAVGIRLEVAASKRYCASFEPATTVRADATIEKRRNAPAPVVCPFVTISTGTATSTCTTTTSSTTGTIDPATCPTTTTLGAPPCGPSGPGTCGGICFGGQECALNASDVCECQGPVSCGGYSHLCGADCPPGQACVQRPVPEGCGPIGCACQ